MSAQNLKKLPGVLSFQRGIVITDALLFDDIDGDLVPLPVQRHGIRGTQNVNKKDKNEVSNIQTTDTAKMSPESSAVIARFSLRFIDLKNTLFACAPSKGDEESMIRNMRDSVRVFVEKAQQSEGLQEIARRYARNIFNGRWLWRNRVIAQKIDVDVEMDGKSLGQAEALQIPLNSFENYTEAEKQVADVIADNLRGRSNGCLTVSARMYFGMQGALEVFCSQNYLEKPPKGFARSLYCIGNGEKRSEEVSAIRIMGQAAIRDQKVSNALRTFDTWYPEFSTFGKPIPIEPKGASLEAQRFFRDKKSDSAFGLALKLRELDPASDHGMYMIASLIRGGVYSESEKSEAKK
jgi:CRISPR-associated protein Csy3